MTHWAITMYISLARSNWWWGVSRKIGECTQLCLCIVQPRPLMALKNASYRSLGMDHSTLIFCYRWLWTHKRTNISAPGWLDLIRKVGNYLPKFICFFSYEWLKVAFRTFPTRPKKTLCQIIVLFFKGTAAAGISKIGSSGGFILARENYS